MLYWTGRWIRGHQHALSTSVFHKIRVPLILYADQAFRSASVPSPCKNRGTKHAGMVELVDSVDLGSTANACRFESCCPHQNKSVTLWVALLFWYRTGLEPILMPNAGGIWQQPVQKLVATIWFCIAKPALESCCPPTDKTRTNLTAKCQWHFAATSSKLNCNYMTLLRKVSNRVLLPTLPIRLEPILMPNAGGIWRPPGQNLIATI